MPPTIRLAVPDDAEQVQAVYAPYCRTPISFEPEPPGAEEIRGRLVKILAYRWSVDTSVYARQGRHRRGVGRALYTSLLALLPLQGFVNAYAGVTLPNPASVGLHKAMGFQQVGVYQQVGFKCGAWHDVAWFQRPLQARSSDPPPPRELEEALSLPGWTEALASGLRFL